MSSIITWKVKTPISTETKIDIIFEYLFWQKKANEEEFFWNELTKKEILKLENIRKEDKSDFSVLKKKFLWK